MGLQRNIIKVICLKTCISSEYEFAREGEYYFVDKTVYEYSELDGPINWIEKFKVHMKSFGFGYKEKSKFYPTYGIYSTEENAKFLKNSLGYFDSRNFITIAEYRNTQINDILKETLLIG